jgi:uncharacterized protein YcbX
MAATMLALPALAQAQPVSGIYIGAGAGGTWRDKISERAANGTQLSISTEAGDVQLQPVKPCPRCPIPNIDPSTGQSTPAVGDTLQGYRQDVRVGGAVTFGMNAIPLRGVGLILQVGQAVQADWQF